MDLETTGKKMLEALAVKGQISAMQTQLTDLKGGIADANSAVLKAQETKALNVANRGNAEGVLNDATDNVETIEGQIAQDKANLKAAKLVVGQAEEEVGKYSDDVLSQLDEVTQQFQEAKQTIEAERDKVLKELGVLKEDLEARQEELKALGVELNLVGTAPRPKVTTL